VSACPVDPEDGTAACPVKFFAENKRSEFNLGYFLIFFRKTGKNPVNPVNPV